jgi:hypothetical protein
MCPYPICCLINMKLLFQHLLAPLLFLSGVGLFTSCNQEGEGQTGDGQDSALVSSPLAETQDPGCQLVDGTATIRINGVSIVLKAPAGAPIGDLLLLPPWDETEEAWCLRSRTCAKALKKGYRLILPDMGKSMYCRTTYPETRSDWAQAPEFPWLKDTLIPTLQEKYCLLQASSSNYVVGVGAGARGALRLVEELPDLFVAAACMSGDYNPSLTPNDNLYRGFFGDYAEHEERWREEENLCKGIQRIRTPLFLSHGIADDFIPSTQTEFLYNVLHEEHPSLNVQLRLNPEKGYGFAFWNSEMSEVFRFFESTQAARPESP